MNLINFIYSKHSVNFAPMKNILLAISLLTLASCSNQSKSDLEVNEFNEKVQSLDYQVVDIRPAKEYRIGHIERAINLPKDTETFNTPEKALYSDMPIAIYGNTDAEQIAAAQALAQKGYKQIVVLKGGINAWKSNNLPLIEEKEKKLLDSDNMSFEEARKGDKLVMVDFNATWCGPCKVIAPYVHRLKEQRDTDVIVYTIDTDQRGDLAQEYNATSIPLLVFIKNNKELYRSVGIISEQELNAIVDKYK